MVFKQRGWSGFQMKSPTKQLTTEIEGIKPSTTESKTAIKPLTLLKNSLLESEGVETEFDLSEEALDKLENARKEYLASKEQVVTEETDVEEYSEETDATLNKLKSDNPNDKFTSGPPHPSDPDGDRIYYIWQDGKWKQTW